MTATLAIVAVVLVLSGVSLVLAREWSAQFHERWNQKFPWTRWATGPRAMQASRIANLVIGITFILIGALLGVLYMAGK